jgi:ribosomal protein S6
MAHTGSSCLVLILLQKLPRKQLLLPIAAPLANTKKQPDHNHFPDCPEILIGKILKGNYTMARTSTKRPHKLLLEHFIVGKSLTPDEVDKHTNKRGGRHSAMWNLKQLGYTIDVKKEGKTVLAYIMVSEPTNTKEIREQFLNDCAGLKKSVPKKAKKEKKKASVSKKPVPEVTKNFPGNKKLKVMSPQEVTKAIAKKKVSAPASSFQIDPDWDAFDATENLRDII